MTATTGHPTELVAWRGFSGTAWRSAVDVRAFIQANYTPHEGGAEFLADLTERTAAV